MGAGGYVSILLGDGVVGEVCFGRKQQQKRRERTRVVFIDE